MPAPNPAAVPPRLLALLVAMVLAATACTTTGGDETSGAATTAPPGSATTPAPAVPLADLELGLEELVTLDQPLALAVRSGDDRLYVAEKGGAVRAVEEGPGGERRAAGAPVLDLTGQVSGAFEQGLLGIAFSPDGSVLYADYTDLDGDTRVVAYPFDGRQADEEAGRELLGVDQPFENHNGGNLVVDGDGMLWISLGDGGSGGDPEGNAQDLTTLLGSILRIDPRPAGDRPYTVPADNPFAGRADARGEIWAWGLRNPWRFSFDRATGDLWIADVGQASREEVDLAPADPRPGPGANYGWDRLEGTKASEGRPPPGAVPPLFEYDRTGGNCSITGGYVYRGTALPGLDGAYLFGDYCTGVVRALRQEGGRVTEERAFGVGVDGLASFGQDAAGELYVLSLAGGLYRITAGS